MTDVNVGSEVPKERILLTYEPRGRGNQKFESWNYKIDFIYSDDFLKTSKALVYKGNKFLLTKNYLFVEQTLDQDTKESKLLVSDSNAVKYDFKEIDLSFKKFKEHSYSFLDTSENSVFIHVNHFGDKSTYGHIYISDYQGIKYSSSLEFNVKNLYGECEFDKVKIKLNLR